MQLSDVQYGCDTRLLPISAQSLLAEGEPSPSDWPAINSHFGIIDIAGFPKVGT